MSGNMDQMRIGDVFSASRIKENVVIIGCGALGSAVALQLAKLGVPLTLIDGDEVEPHNIPNQLIYGVNDVGRNKARLLCEKLRELTGSNEHQSRSSFVTERDRLTQRIVFACVDSMAARSMIFDSLSDNNGLFFDGRIGAFDYQSYAVQRADLEQMQLYQESIYPDDENVVDRAACGTVLSIGATATLCAANLVWQFIRAINPVGEIGPPNFVTGSVRDQFRSESFYWTAGGAVFGTEYDQKPASLRRR